jgi:hypothetical protein
MSKIADKVKEKLKSGKDKVMDTGEGAKNRVAGDDDSTERRTSGYGSTAYEEGAPGSETGRKDDPLTSYRDKEPMTPAKIKEHEPTAVKRDPSDQRILEPGQRSGTSSEEAAEIARKKGMAKGTAGAAETGSEYEQDTSGTNE